MPDTDITTIKVNPTRQSDQAAYIDAARQGTGATLRIRVRGQRGGERDEYLGLTDAMRRQLIRALGGTIEHPAIVNASPPATPTNGVGVLWSWSESPGAWVETGPGDDAAVERKYKTAIKYEITGAAFVVMAPGQTPRGTPAQLGARLT